MKNSTPSTPLDSQAADTVLATMDLGSTSFHLRIDQLHPRGKSTCIGRYKQKMHLRKELTSDHQLTRTGQQRALECFRQFAQHMAQHGVTHRKFVGTYTLRTAVGLEDFLTEAEDILGAPIELISGDEEARLIYLGATLKSRHHTPQLVIDIGGGSTELILGTGKKLTYAISFPMGCVSFQQQFFPDGKLTASAFEAGIDAAKRFLHESPSFWDHFPKTPTLRSVGISGTLQAISNTLTGCGHPYGRMTRPMLQEIQDKLLQVRNVANIHFEGLKPDRAWILPGGLCIISGLFDILNLTSLTLSRGGLREGLLFELQQSLELAQESRQSPVQRSQRPTPAKTDTTSEEKPPSCSNSH